MANRKEKIMRRKTDFAIYFQTAIEEKKLLSNFSQREFAKKIGATEAAVSRWLNGNREPSLYFIAKIAKELEVTTDYLLTGKKDFPT